MISTTTNTGLHEYVGQHILSRSARQRLKAADLFQPDGFQLSRKSVAWIMELVASISSEESILGDDHVVVLEAAN